MALAVLIFGSVHRLADILASVLALVIKHRSCAFDALWRLDPSAAGGKGAQIAAHEDNLDIDSEKCRLARSEHGLDVDRPHVDAARRTRRRPLPRSALGRLRAAGRARASLARAGRRPLKRVGAGSSRAQLVTHAGLSPNRYAAASACVEHRRRSQAPARVAASSRARATREQPCQPPCQANRSPATAVARRRRAPAQPAVRRWPAISATAWSAASVTWR